MAEARLPLVRRLVVAGSIGLFALAIFQAQHGCSSEDADASNATVQPTPGPAPAPAPEPIADPPDPVDPPTPEENSEPVGVAEPTPAAGTRNAKNEEAETPMFLGASKSGMVMERPRKPQREAVQQQAQAPNPPPQQQNARPGS